MGVGKVSRTSNSDSRLSELFVYLNTWILELAKGVKVGLYMVGGYSQGGGLPRGVRAPPPQPPLNETLVCIMPLLA